MSSKGVNMSEFRYYCLHDDGRIAIGEHVETTDLDAAINHAYESCRSHPKGAFRYVEVWRGSERLYFSPRQQECRQTPDHSGTSGRTENTTTIS
jgi:hypothetical protein